MPTGIVPTMSSQARRSSDVPALRVENVWKEALIPILVSRGHDRKYDEAEYRAERQKKKKEDQERERAEQR